MKLKNRKTGEIIEVESLDVDSPTNGIAGIPSFDRKGSYNSLSELNEEWEDVPEEPETFWFIDEEGIIRNTTDENWPEESVAAAKEIGNYFETKEEAEKAVERLRALKRLEDKGFRFKYWTYKMDEPRIENHTHFMIVGVCEDGVRFDDLDLLFCTEVKNDN